MNDTDYMTAVERSNAIGLVAGALMDLIREKGQAWPDMYWTDMIFAAAVACRGVAAQAMAASPDLTLDKARTLMLRQFIDVLALPPELVRTMKAAEGETPQTIVVPVKKHS